MNISCLYKNGVLRGRAVFTTYNRYKFIFLNTTKQLTCITFALVVEYY